MIFIKIVFLIGAIGFPLATSRTTTALNQINDENSNSTRYRRSVHTCRDGCFDDACYRMPSGATLKLGQKLISKNHRYQLAMQRDGNLVIYCGPATRYSVVWATHTDGKHVKNGLVFQTDGNMVLYDIYNRPIWTTHTDRKSVVRFIMQDDGNFVGYDNCGRPIWTSNTHSSRQCGKIQLPH